MLCPVPSPKNLQEDFFYQVVDASITFETAAAGPASALVLHQNGLDQRAKRMAGDAPAPKEHKEVTVDPTLFDGYTGRDELAPSFVLAVTREGTHLFVEATGQPKFEVFPEGDRDFFFKAVDAQLTFEVDAQGKAVALVLHQNGLHQRAKRVE